MKPKIAPPGRGLPIALLSLSLAFVLISTALAAKPSWWARRGVTLGGADASDYAPVNQGQLKKIAVECIKEFDSILPGGAGSALLTGTASLKARLTATSSATSDYSPVSLGQLKTVAKPFYSRLKELGYIAELPPALSGTAFPASDDYASANIGQVKSLFAFDAPTLKFTDTDADGLADWWELANFGDLTHQANGDEDGDGIPNVYEEALRLDPNIRDIPGDYSLNTFTYTANGELLRQKAPSGASYGFDPDAEGNLSPIQ